MTELPPRLFSSDEEIVALGEAWLALRLPRSAWTHEAHLAATTWLLLRRPDIDAAVRPLLRGLVLPEAVRMARGVYRRRRLTVPTLVVYGRLGAAMTTATPSQSTRMSPSRHSSKPMP